MYQFLFSMKKQLIHSFESSMNSVLSSKYLKLLNIGKFIIHDDGNVEYIRWSKDFNLTMSYSCVICYILCIFPFHVLPILHHSGKTFFFIVYKPELKGNLTVTYHKWSFSFFLGQTISHTFYAYLTGQCYHLDSYASLDLTNFKQMDFTP